MAKSRRPAQRDPAHQAPGWLPQALLGAAVVILVTALHLASLPPGPQTALNMLKLVLVATALPPASLVLIQRVGHWLERRRLASMPPWELVLMKEREVLEGSGKAWTHKQLLPRLASRVDAAEEVPDTAAAFTATAKVVDSSLDDATLSELRRHSGPLCRAMGRYRFADAAAEQDKNALPLIIVALLAAAHAAGQTLAAQQSLLQAAIPHTALVSAWALPPALVRPAAKGAVLRQLQLLGSTRLLGYATDAAAPQFAISDGLRHAAPPAEQLLGVALEAAAAHSESALLYAAAAADGAAGSSLPREARLNLQDWAAQATEVALHCAERLHQSLDSPQLPPRAAQHAAEALQRLATAALPGDKGLRGLSLRFATLVHHCSFAADAMAAAPPQQLAGCVSGLVEVLAKRLQVRGSSTAMRLGYLAALAAPWAAACRHLPPRSRWVQRLQLARALLHTALEASSGPDGGATALLALSTSGRQQTAQQQAAMLADSAASAMAAVVLEALAIPCRPASKGGAASAGTAGSKGSGNSSKGSGKDSRGSATGSGGEGGKLARPPPPLAEQLAAAGYLADLTWMLEHAGSGGPAAGGSPRGSAPASGPSAGLWAAYNALAAIAGWLEGAVLHSSFPGSTIPQPSVALQAAAARSAVAMVSAARGMMGAGSGSGPAANGSGSNSGAAAAGAKQRWQAGGKLCRMASTGASILAGFVVTNSMQLVAAQHGGALAVAQAVDIAAQSDAQPAELQSLLEELLPPLAALLAEDTSGRKALAADGTLPWEPLFRSLTRRLSSWSALPPLLEAVSDAVAGRAAVAARVAAAEAASAALLQGEAEAAAAAAAAEAAAGLRRRRKTVAEPNAAPPSAAARAATSGARLAAAEVPVEVRDSRRNGYKDPPAADAQPPADCAEPAVAEAVAANAAEPGNEVATSGGGGASGTCEQDASTAAAAEAQPQATRAAETDDAADGEADAEARTAAVMPTECESPAQQSGPAAGGDDPSAAAAESADSAAGSSMAAPPGQGSPAAEQKADGQK